MLVIGAAEATGFSRYFQVDPANFYEYVAGESMNEIYITKSQITQFTKINDRIVECQAAFSNAEYLDTSCVQEQEPGRLSVWPKVNAGQPDAAKFCTYL
jgi:hypothetical protein